MEKIKWEIRKTDVFEVDKMVKNTIHEAEIPFGRYQIEVSEGRCQMLISSFDTGLWPIEDWFREVGKSMDKKEEDYSFDDIVAVFQEHFSEKIKKAIEFEKYNLRNSEWRKVFYPKHVIHWLPTPLGCLNTLSEDNVFKPQKLDNFGGTVTVGAFSSLEDAKEWHYTQYCEILEKSSKLQF